MLTSAMNVFRNGISFTVADWRRGVAVSVPAALMSMWLHTALAQTTNQQSPADNGQPTQTNPVENTVLQSLLAGNTEAAVRYLSAGGGDSEAISSRAQALLRALDAAGTGADPAQVQFVAVAISDAVDQALNTTPVFGAQFGLNLQLSPQSIGFDFGTPDSGAPPGFVKVTTNDSRLITSNGRTLRRPEGTRLQSDGVLNVRQFQTGLPNGEWRVTLMTDDLGPDQGLDGPFGSTLRLNDRVLPISGGDRSQWLPSALIGTGAENASGGPSGGIVQTTVTVTDGRLVIDFGAGEGFYLTGIVLQPADEPNIVRFNEEAASFVATRPERSNRVRNVIAQRLGDVLSRVASAAGPNQVANSLQANLLFNQPTAQVSEN